MKAYCTLALLFTLAFVNAQDRLETTGSVFNLPNYELEYHTAIRQKLLNGFDDSGETCMLTLPSFAPESALFISYDSKKGKYFVTYNIAESKIWSAKKRETVKIKTYRCEISHAAAKQFKNLYVRATTLAQNPEHDDIGLDGISYYFLTNDSTHPLSGTIWEPGQDSAIGQVIAIGQDIISKVQKQQGIIDFDATTQQRIQKIMEELLPEYKTPAEGLIIPDGFQIPENMILHAVETAENAKDGAWFTNDVHLLIIEPDSNKGIKSAYMFDTNTLPAAMVTEIQQHFSGEKIDMLSLPSADLYLDLSGFNRGVTPIKRFFFTSNKGFSLGDTRDKAIMVYNTPDKITTQNGIERCEWIFKGQLAGHKPISGSIPVALNSYGQHVIMYFTEEKLVGMILYNDIP